MKTFNFVDPKFHESQRDLFLDDDILTPFEEHETMAHLMVRAGKFPSVSQARKTDGISLLRQTGGYSCWEK